METTDKHRNARLIGEVKKMLTSPLEAVRATRRCSSSCPPRTRAKSSGTTGMSSQRRASPSRPKPSMT
jgi:hypothetical protein